MVALRVNGRTTKRMDCLSLRNDLEKGDQDKPFDNDKRTDRRDLGMENRDTRRAIDENEEIAFVVRTKGNYGQTSLSVHLHGSVDVKIHWGNGTVDRVKEPSEFLLHTFAEDGEHTVRLFESRVEEFAVSPDWLGGCVVKSTRPGTNRNVRMPRPLAWRASSMPITPRKTNLKRGFFLMRVYDMDPRLLI